jgi:fibronectin type 3 domain-containing protein
MRGEIMRKILFAALLIAFVPGIAHAQHSVALSWTAPTGSPAAVSYNIYRGTGACASGLVFSKVNSSAISGTSFTDSSSALSSNTTYCYQATAVDAAGIESIPSNQAAAAIPGPSGAPTGLTIVTVTQP